MKRLGLMQTMDNTSIMFDDSNATSQSGGGGTAYVDPSPAYLDTTYPTILDVEPVFVNEPVIETIDTAPVYVDPGGQPIDYVSVNDIAPDDSDIQPQLIPASDVQTVIDPGTAQTPTPTTAPTTNGLFEWIKANPIKATAIALGLYFLLADKKRA